MEQALRNAGKAPKELVTSKLCPYLDGIEPTFTGNTGHIQGSPFSVKASTSLIERFHGTLKRRTKVMRGLKSLATLKRFTDGFVVYYNYFRPHEALNGKRPAEAAKMDYKVKNWADVCKLVNNPKH